MEITSQIDTAILTRWMEDFADSVDVEGKIRDLLEDFEPTRGGNYCHTARAFKEAVNSIMDQRDETVIKQNVDGITGEARDALVEMVATEVHRQVSDLIATISRRLLSHYAEMRAA